jgi:hypothetical protein
MLTVISTCDCAIPILGKIGYYLYILAFDDAVCRGLKMNEWLIFLLAFAAYFILMRWILPKLGVKT